MQIVQEPLSPGCAGEGGDCDGDVVKGLHLQAVKCICRSCGKGSAGGKWSFHLQ